MDYFLKTTVLVIVQTFLLKTVVRIDTKRTEHVT